jgi:Tfp pilus assembly protein PilN
MNENEVIDSIKGAISLKGDSYEIKVLERSFTARTEYVAQIGLISREGLIDLPTIKALVELTMDGECDDLKVESTKIEPKDLAYDILVISAKINLV